MKFIILIMLLLGSTPLFATTYRSLSVSMHYLHRDYVYLGLTGSEAPASCKVNLWPFWTASVAQVRIYTTTGMHTDTAKALIMNAIVSGAIYDYDISVNPSTNTCDIIAIGNW